MIISKFLSQDFWIDLEAICSIVLFFSFIIGIFKNTRQNKRNLLLNEMNIILDRIQYELDKDRYKWKVVFLLKEFFYIYRKIKKTNLIHMFLIHKTTNAMMFVVTNAMTDIGDLDVDDKIIIKKLNDLGYANDAMELKKMLKNLYQ
jgi:hypothetical protein